MKNISLLLFAILFSHLSMAQDIILKTSGDELPAKVTEITLTDVVYKKPDSLEGRTFTIPKKEVFMIKFANGSKEVLSQDTNIEKPVATDSPEAMYARGRADARKYYNGNSVLWGSAAASLLFPYGYIVPITLGAVKPRIKPNSVPEMALLQNRNYVRGYESQAHSRKVGKAAAGAGIGTAVVLSFVVILVSSLTY